LQPSSERQVFFGADTGFVDCPVYDRTLMHEGHVVRGPAIVEQMDTTTAVPPDFIVQVDDLRNLYLSQSDVA
jgi:N-methylhydantoinase A